MSNRDWFLSSLELSNPHPVPPMDSSVKAEEQHPIHNLSAKSPLSVKTQVFLNFFGWKLPLPAVATFLLFSARAAYGPRPASQRKDTQKAVPARFSGIINKILKPLVRTKVFCYKNFRKGFVVLPFRLVKSPYSSVIEGGWFTYLIGLII